MSQITKEFPFAQLTNYLP